MTGSTRAFLISGLMALPGAGLLYLFSILGVSGAWSAMVHLTIFGWITAMIVAVNYHTMPVFAARDFPSTRLIWGHWAVFNVGLTLATAGMLTNWRTLTMAGLLLESGAALLFISNTILLFLRGPQRLHSTPPTTIPDQPRVDRIGTRATKAAGLALPLALLLLFAARLGWISGAWVLPAEHLATLGWLMLMIVGVAYHVLPRFSGYGTRGPGWARLQLGCHLGALTLMVPALGFGWSQLFAVSGLLMTLALGLFAWTIWPTLNCRLQNHPKGARLQIG
jgi:hypothetical protein